MENIRVDIRKIFDLQQANKQKIKETTAVERIEKLQLLRNTVLSQREKLRNAVYADFKKAPAEVDLTEIYMVSAEVKNVIRNLNKWMRPKKIRPPLAFFGAKSELRYVPKGVCLIISPWNYFLCYTSNHPSRKALDLSGFPEMYQRVRSLPAEEQSVVML